LGLFAPLALLALPLLGLVIALYLLKLRRPSAPVASLHLWGSITRDREANSLWQRLRVSILLLLQVVILLALILALARPWVPSREPIGQNVVIVMDVSASMASRDDPGGPTRLQNVQSKAKQIIDNLPQGATAMLITSGDHAAVQVPSTDDRSRLRDAVDALSPQPVPTDLTEAMKLTGVVAGRQANSAVWVLSDGAFASVADLVDPIPAAVTFVPVGKSSSNQGITALSLDKGSAGLSLFLQVSNSDSFTVTRRLDLLADDAPWSARNIEIGPAGTQEVVVPDVPLGARVLGAELAGADALDIDNRAWVVNRASVPANVLLVSTGNKFLELALSLLPTVTLYKVAPADYKPDATINGLPFDLTVFDARTPVTALQSLPAGALMLFAPPSPNPLIQVSNAVTDPVLSVPRPADANDTTAGHDQLLRYVDLSQLHIAEANSLVLPTWGRSVLSSQSGPLIVVGEQAGRNVAVFGFDLRDSDLAVQTAFPLLMRNLVTYLLPLPAGGLPDQVSPGQPVTLESLPGGVDRIVVEDPGAREHAYNVSGPQARVAFGDTSQVGVYYVTQYAGTNIVAQEAFAVNLFSRDESLTPPNARPGLPVGEALAGSAEASSDDRTPFKREMWPLLALAGFIVLLVEWLYAQRVVIRRAITEAQNRRALQKLENEKL
jgi:Ca-activated chloride channel family protein